MRWGATSAPSERRDACLERPPTKASGPPRGFGAGVTRSRHERRRHAAVRRSRALDRDVRAGALEHHFVADGPVHNGAPGEAVTPAELFLGGIAACGIELVQAIARAEDVPLGDASAEVSGELDPSDPVRSDVNVFNRVHLSFRLAGVTKEQGRCWSTAQEEVTALRQRRSCDA